MAVLGIIAEFNPFHNGHRHLLQEAQKRERFEGTVCVMSGHFLQRGEPAVCNKWSRAAMALQNGVDLVIELPFCFSCRSAYFFARGALQLLQRTGIITDIAFGSESKEVGPLETIAGLLSSETPAYRRELKDALRQGLSFAAARARAISAFLPEDRMDHQAVLAAPNNILAIEYLKVMRQENLNFRYHSVPRVGDGFHSTRISDYASATAIRHALTRAGGQNTIAPAMPASSFQFLEEELNQGRAPVTHDLLGPLLLYRLRMMTIADLQEINEVAEGLENRISRAATRSTGWEELHAAVLSKRYSATRINRVLVHALMGLNRSQAGVLDQQGPGYIRILGSTGRGFNLLKQIKNKTALPVLEKGKGLREALRGKDAVISAMLGFDIKATDIYQILYPNPAWRTGGQDFLTPPVIIP